VSTDLIGYWPDSALLTHLCMNLVCLLPTHLDIRRRSIPIWLLDFNQCKSFSEDAAGLKQLTEGFYFNDEHYPRPKNTDPKDEALWELHYSMVHFDVYGDK
jgi:hypothetical protein